MRMRRTAGLVALVLMVLVSTVSAHPVVMPRESPSEEHEEAEREEHEAQEREREGEPGLGTSVVPAARESCTQDDDTLRLLPRCHGASVAAPGTTSQPLRFTKVLVGTGGDVESSITAGPKGTFLACSHGGFEKPSSVWASVDGGRSWKRADPAPNPIVSGDCDITILGDGAWGVVFDTLASATVAISRDRGRSWSIAYTAAVPAGSVDRPWLVADGNTVVLAYSNAPGAYQPAVQLVAVSTDGGRTWGNPRIVNTTDPPARPHAVMGRPVVHGKRILIPTMMFDAMFGGPSWLYLLASGDGGQTWTRRLVQGPYQTAFHFPSLTRAPNGTLYTTLPTGVAGEAMDVSVLVSRNDGRTWEEFSIAYDVTFPGVVTSIWADARPDGSATLAWMAVTDPATYDPIRTILGQYPPKHRQVWAARVGPKGVLVGAQPVSAPVQDPSGYEFLIVDHDAKGRAHIVAPLDTGPKCHGPSITGGRLRQCIYDFVER